MEWMLLPLKRYAEFSGRSRRMEYWMFVVFQFLINIALYVISLVLVGGSAAMMMMGNGNAAAAGAGAMAMGGGMIVVGLLYLVVTLGLIIPGIAVSVRRLHDTNRTGWWIVAPLIGYVVMVAGIGSRSGALSAVGGLVAFGLGITVLVFLFLDGTVGANRHGADPKGRADASVFA